VNLAIKISVDILEKTDTINTVMKNDPTILDPTIKVVADAYNFNVSFCEIENKWIVKESGDKVDFYWNSTYSIKLFWEELRRFFFNSGREYEINRY
jgi:hypothetical protein